MLVVGLTGLIGSGKSTAADLFAALDVPVIDTDIIARELTVANGLAISSLADAFGLQIINIDGSLNRARLREIVFNDHNQRIILEQILHPMILKELQQRIKAVGSCDYLIAVVPLLFRVSEYMTLISRSLFVDCDYDMLLNRVKKRDKLTKPQIDAILAEQVSRDKQVDLADDIIRNEGNLVQLSQQVSKLHQKYLLMGKNIEI